jgi:hypothetical protein
MLYVRGFSRQDILELFRFIDWVMILPEELETRFSDAILEYEEEMQMPYVTNVERKGIERGRMEGRREGRMEGHLEMSREALLNILEARFGYSPPPSVAELIGRIHDLSVLKTLLKKAVTASSPDEFKQILEEI